MSARLAVLLALLAACRCDGPSQPTTPGDGAPEAALVAVMPDPYLAAPARGTVPSVDRAAAVLAEAGRSFGWGEAAAASIRAHAGEAWARRVVLFVDHGGTPQLEAAWTDLLSTAVESPGVDAEVKLRLRQAQARVLDDRTDQVDEQRLRRRLVAEIGWAMVQLGPVGRDGG